MTPLKKTVIVAFFYTLFALKGVTHTAQVIATISEIKTPCVGKAVKNKSLMN